MNIILRIFYYIKEKLDDIKANTAYKKYLLSDLSLKELVKICKYYGLKTRYTRYDNAKNIEVEYNKNYRQLNRTIMMSLNISNIQKALSSEKIKTSFKDFEEWRNGK